MAQEFANATQIIGANTGVSVSVLLTLVGLVVSWFVAIGVLARKANGALQREEALALYVSKTQYKEERQDARAERQEIRNTLIEVRDTLNRHVAAQDAVNQTSYNAADVATKAAQAAAERFARLLAKPHYEDDEGG